MGKECEYEDLCEAKCRILEILEQQSVKGGHEKPDLTGYAGPYWTSPGWNGLTGESESVAKDVNCYRIPTIRKFVKTETHRKMTAFPREIVRKFKEVAPEGK